MSGNNWMSWFKSDQPQGQKRPEIDKTPLPPQAAMREGEPRVAPGLAATPSGGLIPSKLAQDLVCEPPPPALSASDTQIDLKALMDQALGDSATEAEAEPQALPPCAESIARNNIGAVKGLLNGLSNGTLTLKEAGELSQMLADLERFQAQAFRRGKVSETDQQTILNLQAKYQGQLFRLSNNTERSDPANPVPAIKSLTSSIERNLWSQKQSLQSVLDGSFTTRELSQALTLDATLHTLLTGVSTKGVMTDYDRSHIDAAQKMLEKLHQSSGQTAQKDLAQAAPSAPIVSEAESLTEININALNDLLKALASGALSDSEAGRLQKMLADIESAQAVGLRNGHLGEQEKRGLHELLARFQADLSRLTSHSVTGNTDANLAAAKPELKERTASIERNIWNQKWLLHGVRDGSITPKALSQVLAEDAKLQDLLARSNLDGTLTDQEKSDITVASRQLDILRCGLRRTPDGAHGTTNSRPAVSV